MASEQYILTITCANRPGIVAAVAGWLFEHGGDIVESQQCDDSTSGRFFARIAFICSQSPPDLAALRASFIPIVERFGLAWQLRSVSERRRVMLMVSKFDHCLVDLLYRYRIGELPMEITAIVANHPQDTYSRIDMTGIPFHYLQVNAETKERQEADLSRLISETGTELVVLARYMQVLSRDLVSQLIGRCINVHHSFLPGFKGAKPYHQAHQRGVKLIGATAHFVTSDLDEGPIIEQAVTRISYRDTPDDFVRKGRDIERQVLAKALRYYLTDRVIPNGDKTVVFAD